MIRSLPLPLLPRLMPLQRALVFCSLNVSISITVSRASRDAMSVFSASSSHCRGRSVCAYEPISKGVTVSDMARLDCAVHACIQTYQAWGRLLSCGPVAENRALVAGHHGVRGSVPRQTPHDMVVAAGHGDDGRRAVLHRGNQQSSRRRRRRSSSECCQHAVHTALTWITLMPPSNVPPSR